MANPLTPSKVFLESSLKFFGLDVGSSSGSTLGIEYSVPEGLTGVELKKAILDSKMGLDLTVLAMEKMRGAVDHQVFSERKAFVQASYGRLLNPPVDPPLEKGIESQGETPKE